MNCAPITLQHGGEALSIVEEQHMACLYDVFPSDL